MKEAQIFHMALPQTKELPSEPKRCNRSHGGFWNGTAHSGLGLPTSINNQVTG
uniref:Uncharacterized protein n=1 Tax=Trichinella nativa TaxID=6335 RepID=A0A0V1KIJ6_9BILA